MASETDSGDLREFYANFFRVGYNALEFLLDFGRQFEQEPEHFDQRVITTPSHAKVLSDLLQQSVSAYEERFGEIANGKNEEP
jgi:hypothetical protein